MTQKASKHLLEKIKNKNNSDICYFKNGLIQQQYIAHTTLNLP